MCCLFGCLILYCILIFTVFDYRSADHRDLHVLTHSFPTRRSSDLCAPEGENLVFPSCLPLHEDADVIGEWSLALVKFHMSLHAEGTVLIIDESDRSEEHTSELQSLMRISYAVFCLKKKTKTRYTYNTQTNPKMTKQCYRRLQHVADNINRTQQR